MRRRIVLATCLVGLTCSVQAGEFRLERLDDRVVVWDGDELFTEYRFKDRRPCLFPVLGPTGHPMTRRWPLSPDPEHPESEDHPHHSGIWYAHGDVRLSGAGLKGDFWHRDSIEHQHFLDFQTHAKDDRLLTENSWKHKDGTELCRDQTRIQFGRGARARWIDFDLTLMAPVDQAVVLGDTKEGTMAIRVPETMTVATESKHLRHLSKGRITNSEGITGREAWGKRAKWCVYDGPVEGEHTVIAIFDHPDNPRHPTWWMARTYGLFAANPFGQSFFEKKPRGSGDFTIPAGRSVTFRYRFLFQSGPFDAKDIEARYKAFVTDGTVSTLKLRNPGRGG